MNDDLEVEGINRGKRVVVLTCGCFVPVTDWFDKHGEDCAPNDAIVCVAGDDHHGWFTVDLEAFKIVTVH